MSLFHSGAKMRGMCLSPQRVSSAGSQSNKSHIKENFISIFGLIHAPLGLPMWRWWERIHRTVAEVKRGGFKPWVGKIPWRRTWPPAPVFSPGRSHGQRNLAGHSPRGHRRLNTTEHTCTLLGIPEETPKRVQFSRSVVSDSLRPHESQHARPPCPSPTPPEFPKRVATPKSLF